MLQEFPTENLFFDRSRADPYSPLSSHQYCKGFFLFGLLNFAIKLKTLIVRFIVYTVEMKILLINVYHGGQILNTSTGMGYDILTACTFSTDESINLRDLKRQIYIGLDSLANSISALVYALADSDDFFIIYLRLFLMKFEVDSCCFFYSLILIV
jgi:hypothetical protein